MLNMQANYVSYLYGFKFSCSWKANYFLLLPSTHAFFPFVICSVDIAIHKYTIFAHSVYLIRSTT
jgi:hypothetical protein